MTVSISGQAPGEQQNGLLAIEDDLLHERTPDTFLAVTLIDRASLKYNDVKQEWSATIRFKHIEPVIDIDADDESERIGRDLLESMYARRTGQDTLPIPVEEKHLDLDTPLQDQEPDEDDADDLDDDLEGDDVAEPDDDFVPSPEFSDAPKAGE